MTTIPFWHKIRWRLSLSLNRLHIRCGLFLLEICCNHLESRWNDISMDQRVSGIWISWIPIRLIPGQAVPFHGWRKVTNIEHNGAPCQES